MIVAKENFLEVKYKPRAETVIVRPLIGSSNLYLLATGFGDSDILNWLSSMGTFASTFSTVIFERESGLFLGPLSIENGVITPATGL